MADHGGVILKEGAAQSIAEDGIKIAGTVNDADNFHCTFVDTVKDNVAL